ncbi:MAG: PIN domain-containing protein [Candidatus Thiosymbion ectosymbiont of Robbea hypermnestra]|nr:PIN domain-containing protein [Candidatus Thiosymbion ectosymbiont of Robbea hypermnestra]
MSGNRDIIYWDSCVFYALIKAEDHRDGELEGIRQTQRSFDAGEIVLITSAITLVEVLPFKLTDGQRLLFEGISKRSNFSWVDASPPVAKLAVELRNKYIKPRGDKEVWLSTPDAIHIASAIAHKSDRMITLDGNDKPSRQELGILKIAEDLKRDYDLIVSRPDISGQRETDLDEHRNK